MRTGRWNRDFSLFFVARAAARLGDMMLPVALAAGLIQYDYGVGAVGGAMRPSVRASPVLSSSSRSR